MACFQGEVDRLIKDDIIGHKILIGIIPVKLYNMTCDTADKES